MKRSIPIAFASLTAALALIVSGCQYTEDNPRTTQGAAVGAAAGGVLGAIAGNDMQGAAIGAVLGGLAGGAIGQHMDQKNRSAEETREAYDYDASAGEKLEPIAMQVQPEVVKPGQTVNLTTRYAVLAPNNTTAVSVREAATVTHNGQKVAETSITVDRTPGTYTSSVPIRLPDSASAGRYEVRYNLSSSAGSANQNSSFDVQR